MNIQDVVTFLNQSTGQHFEKIWIPSQKRDVHFRPLTTADVKTLLRTSTVSEFDLANEIIKISLFDKLLIEQDIPVNSKNINKIDYLSFLMGLRQILGNSVKFKFTCLHCNQTFEYEIDLEDIFGEFLMNFDLETQSHEYVYLDPKTCIEWHFNLKNYSMMDYLFYRFYMNQLKSLDQSNSENVIGKRYIIPILYCDEIWFKVGDESEQIEGWKNLEIQDKIEFFNKHIPAKMMLDITTNKKKRVAETLPEFVEKRFAEYQIEKIIDELPVKCPNLKCGKEFKGAFDVDSFFTF